MNSLKPPPLYSYDKYVTKHESIFNLFDVIIYQSILSWSMQGTSRVVSLALWTLFSLSICFSMWEVCGQVQSAAFKSESQYCETLSLSPCVNRYPRFPSTIDAPPEGQVGASKRPVSPTTVTNWTLDIITKRLAFLISTLHTGGYYGKSCFENTFKHWQEGQKIRQFFF